MFQPLSKKLKHNIKAVFAVVLLITLLADGFFNVAKAADTALPVTDGGPEITSASAVVMDINSGAVLYAKNPTAAHQPSSLTKLVTALVCAEKLSMNSPVIFSSNASSQDFPTASNAGLKNGETTTVADAITAMIMCSADDCAVALAEKAGGDVTGFSTLMNTYASENGYKNTNFINSNGRHVEGHYTCAYDMALAASELMNTLPEFKAAASGESAVISASGASLSEITVTNTHRFIKGTDSYSYCYAGKTGGTAYGGDDTWSLCTFASYKGLDLVCIIMGAPENDDTYSDTKVLFDYAFENYTATAASTFMTSNSEEIGTLFNNGLLFDTENHGSIFTNEEAMIILPNNADSSKVTSQVTFTQIHEFSYGNNTIGKINFYYEDRLAGSADIIFYTENASMQQSEFNKYFPDFLINPETNQGANIYSDFGSTDTTEKQSFFDKIKAGIYSLYTPAKSFAAICAVLIFLIGLLVLILLFPVEVKKRDKLYKQERESTRYSSDGDELSEVHSTRNPAVEDMHEIK